MFDLGHLTPSIRWRCAGGPGVPTLAFSPTLLIGTANFTNSNATMETTTSTTSAIGTVAIVGKKCFTMTLLAAGTGNYGTVGVANSGAAADGLGFDGNHSIALYSNGSIFGPSGGGAPSYGTVGDQISVLVDQTASIMWWTPDGVNFYNKASATVGTAADVAAGSSSVGISAITALGAIYPAAGSFQNATWKWTYGAYAFTPPTGFTSM